MLHLSVPSLLPLHFHLITVTMLMGRIVDSWWSERRIMGGMIIVIIIDSWW